MFGAPCRYLPFAPKDPAAWDAVRNASSQFEYDCKASERLPDEEAAPDFDADGDSDLDGVKNSDDLCSGTVSSAKVWADGEWAGCAAGQHRDK